MSANIAPKKKKVRLPGGRGLLTKTQFREVMAQLEALIGFDLVIEGVERVNQVGPGSVYAKLKSTSSGSGAAADPPLWVTASGTVVVGTVGGVIPTINSDPISSLPAPVLDIDPEEESQFIVLNITGTLSVDSGVYVQGMTSITSVTITVETVDPGDAGSRSDSGEFKVVLATFYKAEGEEVTKTGQPLSGSQNVQVCDDGTGTATGTLNLTSNIPS